MPVAAGVEPRVERHRAAQGRVEAADRVGKERERDLEPVPEAVGLVLGGRDQELVREPAGGMRHHDEPVALGDHVLAPGNQLAHAAVAGPRPLGGDRRRHLADPGELGVRVRETRARLAPLVEKCLHVAESLSRRGRRAGPPGLCD